MLGWGVKDRHILKYEEKVRAGEYLVIAHGDGDEARRAHQILEATSPDDLDKHEAA